MITAEEVASRHSVKNVLKSFKTNIADYRKTVFLLVLRNLQNRYYI